MVNSTVPATNTAVAASPPVPTKMSFAQLEGLWITEGGNPTAAPIMAAIALAESGGIPSRANWNDSNGKGGIQASLGLWQISNGTMTPFNANWADPATNAKAAIAKYNGALSRKQNPYSPWGTYTNGAYKTTLPQAYALLAPVPYTGPTASASSSPSSGSSSSASSSKGCYWKIDFGVGSVCMDPILWGALILAGGVGLLVGASFIVVALGSESKSARKVVGHAAKLAKFAV